jgi:pyoverdine/dityrosine biosynthesis protein Dit1
MKNVNCSNYKKIASLEDIDQFEKRKTKEIKRNHNYLVRRLASDLKASIQTF